MMTPRNRSLAGLLALSLTAAAPMATPALAQEEATAAPAEAQAEEAKSVSIAVVDMDEVIASSSAGKALQEKLDTFQTETRTEAETRQGKLVEMRDRLTDEEGGLNTAERAELQKSFEEASLDLRRFQDEKTLEAQKIRNDGMIELQGQVEPIFKALQEEFDYDLILNAQSGAVMMAGERIDITQKVIDRLE